MDVSSLAASLVMAQAASTQQAIATRVVRQNIDSEKLVLQLLAPPQNSSANLAAGTGGALNISA